jgi:hypothetical protein
MTQDYPKKTINYLISDNNLLNSYNVDATVGIVSYPNTISKKIVTQDSNGRWSEQYTEEESPIKNSQQEKQQERDDIDTKIDSFQQTSAILDSKILEINSQINIKKSQIVNLVSTAVSAGCSYISTIGSSGAQNVGGVAIGVGRTVYDDAATISIYSDLSNYSTDNPFGTNSTVALSISNLGTGYITVTIDNGGSSVGSYSSIPTSTVPHAAMIPPPSVSAAICAGYGSSIISIAAELTSLRATRNSYLSDLNTLKSKTRDQELIRWGLKRSDQSIENQKTSNQSLINLINSRSEFQ